jgi:hypothetical protein
MIRALMWKEYREHRAIWLTLAAVGGAGLFGLGQLMAPDGFFSHGAARESLQSVAALFAWTYGLVCGAMLLANEHESGTLTFLDMLPARRLELWLVKCSIGLLLLVMQVAVLACVVVGLGITETMEQFLPTLLAMLLLGLLALSWSLLFSALGDNVLNVIGLSFLGQIAGSLAMLILLFFLGVLLKMIWGGQPNFYDTFQILMLCLGVLGLTVGPILGSARVFTRLDRQRARSARWISRPPADMNVWASWGRLLWLSHLQMRRLLIVLMIFSLVLGFLLLLLGPAAWPVLTLLLGVLCGVTVWSDEQLSAAFRFLGDQRFPLGRVWLVKVGMRFAVAVFCAFLLLLPSLILAAIHQVEGHAQGDQGALFPSQHVSFFADLFHSSMVGPIVPVGTHLLLWLVYGFTAGHLCGLLFRKSLVAAVVALGFSGMSLCLWVPSLVGIGLHFWQAAGVPLALFIAGWLLMPAWTADRLLARGTFVRLGIILLAAALWTAGGLWYRIAEVPDLPDNFSMPTFAATIPSMDQTKNAAGMEMHAAWHEVEQLTQALRFNNERPRKPLFPNDNDARSNTFQSEILAVYSDGWPNRPSDLGDKLDAWFQKEWYEHLRKAAKLPLGVVEDAKLLTVNSHTGRWDLLVSLNELLAVRGLQMQTRGDHKTFVDNLEISLVLSRNVQNHAPPLLVRFGRQAELACVNALDRWLEKLPGHPELLGRVRDILLQHLAQVPDEIDVLRTTYLIAQNTLEQNPEAVAEGEIGAMRERMRAIPELQRGEMELVSLLWRIPWEHERHQRILRVVFEGNPGQRLQARKWGGLYMSSLDSLAQHVIKQRELDKRTRASFSAAVLKVSLRLYHAKNGKFPGWLADLGPPRVAPGQVVRFAKPYLPAIPLDPFNNKPFHYRVSRGENGRPEVVLWSVGEDGQDDEGRNPGNHKPSTAPGEDLVYRVPLPPH